MAKKTANERTQTLILRAIDANLNRAREGLRVVEDISRFIKIDEQARKGSRNIRHKLGEIASNINNEIIPSRDVRTDCGANLNKLELKRKGIESALYSNIQRVKESLRVLEELSKISYKEYTGIFKKLRFNVYQLESEFMIGTMH
jgi:thiamine-phosphate pyrophosphorylase